MERLRGELDATERPAPTLVGAGQVALERELAEAEDDDAMQIRHLARMQPGIQPLIYIRCEAGLLRGNACPAVVHDRPVVLDLHEKIQSLSSIP